MLKRNYRYILVVAAMCGLSAATVGLITNVAGLFFGPMAEEFGILRGAASATLTIANICVALGGLATRRLTKAVPLRALLIACGAVLVASTFALAFAPSIGVSYLLCAARGLAGGVIGFVLITYVLNKWFSARLGLATSLAMGASGLAGALLTPPLQGVVDAFGWRWGMVCVGALTLVLCLPAILFVPSADPRDAGLLPFGASEDKRQVRTGTRDRQPVSVDKALFAAAIVYAVLAASVSAMPQHFPGFAVESGLSTLVGAQMISACMIANTAGKVCMGWLCDRVGARISILAYTLLIGISTVALLVVHADLAFILAAFFFGLCYSRATVGLSMLCREVFGSRGFGVVYPVAALGCSFSNAIFSSAVGFVYDLTGGYTASLVLFLVFVVISAAVVVWTYRRNETLADAGNEVLMAA